ncbi:MAG TPA: alpha-amylase family glycosyl hydrolase, partial [Polyangiaceae bacterium]|nr:alpha-amylase family glycosyl hydrolase [Polyangiaceae bacterium]
MDSNGDGIGDLPGITARLSYLAWLGVDAVWLSPIYPSPMADFGYDISDFCDVDPRFGTLRDFEALIARAKELGLRVILDFVPNHTSDRHPWFVEARSSRDNPKREYYIFRDGRHSPSDEAGALRQSSPIPPNNWLSEFGGSAWQWDARTEQFYYHAYLKEQPDLNWRNPEVRAQMLRVLEFWLERGVDGFRVDTIHHLFKDELLRDNPPNPDFAPGMPPHRRLIREFTTDRPEVQQAIAAIRQVVDRYPDRVLIGEAWLPVDRLMAYYGVDLSGLHLPFNFQLLQARWEVPILRSIVARYEESLPSGAWPNWVLGNHDRPRIASRVGDAQARVAAMLLLTLRGTPTLYYGDELGMKNVAIAPEQVRDPWEKNVPGIGVGRDPERTPMHWSGESGAGFTSGTPWLPLGADYVERNVDTQSKDPHSTLNLYRQLLTLRRREPALSIGSYREIDTGPDVLGYVREYAGRRIAVLLNLSSHPQLPVLNPEVERAKLVLSTRAERELGSTPSEVALGPDEG